jgi:hypothetical protein
MAITGRKPKPEGQSVHRNKVAHDWTEVDDVPFEDGPDLPDFTAQRRAWQESVRSTWDAWRAMPHCTLWGQSDWAFALMTIELVALVYDGETRWAAEVRNRERVLGTTAEFRRDLRIRYVTPRQHNSSSDVGVTNIADYRDF